MKGNRESTSNEFYVVKTYTGCPKEKSDNRLKAPSCLENDVWTKVGWGDFKSNVLWTLNLPKCSQEWISCLREGYKKVRNFLNILKII